MTKLLFGGSGIPSESFAKQKLDSLSGIVFAKKAGLDALELAFVHSVYMKKELATRVAKVAKDSGIRLTVHAPYYINLNPKTLQGKKSSYALLLRAARIGSLAGATDIAFHPGSYLKQEPKKVFQTIQQNLGEIADELTSEHISIMLRPEIGGKISAFGTLEEIIELSKYRNNIQPCIDFAHLIARSNGKRNSYQDFCHVFRVIKKELGNTALQRTHIQFSGIEYTEKGEKRHLNLNSHSLNVAALAQSLVDFNIGGVAICESPEKENDALLMKKEYHRALKNKN